MIYVISPLGEGKKRWTWFLQVNLYTLGVCLASTFTGLIVGSLGLTLKLIQLDLPFWIVGILALAYGLKEFDFIRLPMPQRRWQVPISWINQRPFFGSLAYGLTIGAGFLTFIPYAGFYVWTALALVIGDPKLGALLGFVYGLGRAFSVYLIGFLTTQSDQKSVFEMSAFIFSKAQLWHRLSGFLLLVTAIYILTSA
ncbi:hypothetical protein [Effusibacillus consociatus]|uniref:Urease accessory protein UreH-like transmembrane domain-containing protein n=1 Tax=Effusibacillus consociatus TaxID=1117041 RepID=A0ABV9PYU3_9BACL